MTRKAYTTNSGWIRNSYCTILGDDGMLGIMIIGLGVAFGVVEGGIFGNVGVGRLFIVIID
jgi:hypothetical protein